MAQVSRATHASSLATKLADNTSGDISPQDIREVITDLEDSVTWYDEANVAADTTPQLGGDLDVDGNSIVSTSNGDITIAPDGTGNVILGNYTLNADATVGASQDNYVLTYDHSSGTWGPEASAGGGGGGGAGYSQEEIEDFVGAMVGGSSVQTRITVSYDDANGELDFVVDDALSSYSNDVGYITSAGAPVQSVAGKTGSVALAAGDIASGTFANARIAATNVTQHQAALSIAASQVTGTFGTSSIADEAVTLAKLAHISTDSILGRDTAGSGDVEVLSGSAVKAIIGADAWGDVVDADIVPDADGTRDLGSTGTRFGNAFADVMYSTTGLVVSEAADHPITPAAGVGQIWVTNDATQSLIFTDDAGTDNTILTDAAGATLTDTAIATGDSIPFFDASDSDNAKQRLVSSVITDLSLATLGANTFTGTQDFNGQQVEAFLNKVVTGVSGTLTTTAHAGNIIVTSGNVTVPTAAGFTCVIRAGGAHTVTFNGATSAAMADGDIMTVVVQSATVIHAVLTAAADKVTFS